ncbi:hypothetical protein AV530_014749 [Patagioenas fasciata monilis]|uniref:Uncharacterized protein n=1 Tax=Patagioenas fasciata monilis TaxID=372326 RepID=A0A1V4KZW5_PATFA|nr:hypothetical protein AV530_014749 [Patagioenas fasciata monilis]
MGCPVLHTEQLVSKQREIRTRLMPGPLDEEAEVCCEELACDHGKVLESLQSTTSLQNGAVNRAEILYIYISYNEPACHSVWSGGNESSLPQKVALWYLSGEMYIDLYTCLFIQKLFKKS